MPFSLRRLLAACVLGGAGLLRAGLPRAAESEGRLPFALLGPDQGLPSSSVDCLAQDPDGFLWFGSENGLFRFEGGRSTRWSAENGLPSSFVVALAPARGGGLWVSTMRGLVRFREGRIERPTLGRDPFPSENVQIATDGQGRLWAASARGVFVQRAELDFEALRFQPEGDVRALAHGPRSGAMLLSWAGGIAAFDREGGWRTWGPAEGLPAGGSSMVAEDGEGRLWAAVGRTLRMKPADGDRFVDRSASLQGSLSPNGSPMLDRDGSVWFPTQYGALHIAGDRLQPLDASAGLPFRWLRALLRDREGTLWVLGPGVARILGGERVRTFSVAGVVSGEIAWSILRRRDGRLVLGTDDGAAVLGAAGLHRIPGTEGHRIKAMAEDAAGRLWMGGTTGPILWLQPGEASAQVAPLGDLGQGVNAIFTDRASRTWIGHTRAGLLRWDPTGGRLVAEAVPGFVPVPALGVFDVREDPGGRLWAASTSGLLLRGAEGRWTRFAEADGLRHSTVHSLAFLPDGSCWIAYLEPAGLTRVREHLGRLQVLEHRTRAQGLRTDAVYSLHATPEGHLWAGSDQGVDRLDPPLHLGRHDGMPSEDCALHALHLEGGRLWIGTVGGLVRFDPGVDQLPPPATHLLEVSFGPRRVLPPFGSLAPAPAGEGTVQFHFAAPVYRRERELRFQVRLAGFEGAWREVDSRIVRFPLLPGGRYRFEVRAARADGVFGPVRALDFEILPPWWRTWWALALEAALAIGAVLAIVRLRVASLARSKAALEQEVARRTDELQARNAELSAALGKVRQLSGLLPICASCKKIRDDHGYWNQLEHYISEHSEADFSHGLCPDCVPLLFPDLPRSVQSESKG